MKKDEMKADMKKDEMKKDAFPQGSTGSGDATGKGMEKK